MKEYSGMFPVKKMAKTLNTTRSRYYSWLKNPLSKREKENIELAKNIKQVFERNRCVYGSPRIHRELRSERFSCGKKRVARIMREKGLVARQKRKFKVTTDSKHNLPVAPNRLKRQFRVNAPNRVWVSDITYIWTQEGWLYLCVVIDLFSRRIVGWSMGNTITCDLVREALLMAIILRSPAPGLIFHSDRGVQYAAHFFRDMLKQHKMLQSMSRKGNCWDNACAESFFSSLKWEAVFERTYASRNEARRKVFEYIEVFYNRRRRHSFLDFVSPEEYELMCGYLRKDA